MSGREGEETGKHLNGKIKGKRLETKELKLKRCKLTHANKINKNFALLKKGLRGIQYHLSKITSLNQL